MRNRLALAALLLAAQTSPTLAQSAPQAAPDPPPPPAIAVQSLTVTAERQSTVTTIDRHVYSAGADLQSTTGSVADVLKNVPSVEVDSDGNVSLRGDANVQILIDGKPSTQLSNDNRAAALEEMPADQIESIEVINNPSAAFKADGSAGIINIVTKKNRKPGRSGSMTATVGSEGRKTIGVNGTQRQGRLTLYGGLNIRGDVRKRLFHDHREQLNPFTGATLSTSGQDGYWKTRRLSPTLSGGLDFDATKQDRLSASVSYNSRTGAPRFHELDFIDDATGVPVSANRRDGAGKEHEVNSDSLAKWRHSFSGEGHVLEIALHQSESDEHQRRSYTDVFSIPVGTSDAVERMNLHGDELTRELSVDYSRPLARGAELKLGYDLERDDDDYDNHDALSDPVTSVLAPNPALTDHFKYRQSIHALYGTFQQPFGKWTVEGGVRLEQVFIDFDEVTSAQTGHIAYFRAHPSAHLQYALSDTQILRASYSHRIVRPDPEDLNPYPVYQDAFDLWAGNPRLMPQETHALEGGWSWSHGGRAAQATAYWRETYNAFTNVSRDLPNSPVLVTTKENLGRVNFGGVELAGSGKLLKVLSYNLSGNFFYTEIDAANLGLSTSRSNVSYGLKASLDWKPTGADTFQISGTATGQRLTAQGYRTPWGGVNLGWRRKFDDQLTFVATLADAFNSQASRTLIDQPNLRDDVVRGQLGRVFYIGLTRRFGTGKKAEEKFDFAEPGK